MPIPVDGDNAAFGEAGAKGHPQLRCKLGRQVHIHHARNAETPEQRPPSLPAPDDALPHLCARLNFFVGPYLDIGMNDRTLAHDGFIADDHALMHVCVASQHALLADDGAVDLDAFAHIAAAPQNAARDRGPLVHHGVIPDDRGPLDDGSGLDAHVIAQKHRPDDLGRGVDIHIASRPNARSQQLAKGAMPHPIFQHVARGLHVGWRRAHVAPVARKGQPIQRAVFLQ